MSSQSYLDELITELGKREMVYPQECGGRRRSFYKNHLVGYGIPYSPYATKMELCGLYVKLNNDLYNNALVKPVFTDVQQKVIAYHTATTGQKLYSERRRSRSRSRSRSRTRKRSRRSRSRSGSRSRKR